MFASWEPDDQAIALRVMEQIHRIAKRTPKQAKAAKTEAEQPSLTGLPDEDAAR